MHKHTCTPADFFILLLLTVVALHWGIVFPSLSVSSAPNTHTCTKKNAFADMHGHTRMPTHILIYTHLHTPTGLFVTYFTGSLSAIEEALQMGVWERRSGSGLAEENGDEGKLSVKWSRVQEPADQQWAESVHWWLKGDLSPLWQLWRCGGRSSEPFFLSYPMDDARPKGLEQDSSYATC